MRCFFCRVCPPATRVLALLPHQPQLLNAPPPATIRPATIPLGRRIHTPAMSRATWPRDEDSGGDRKKRPRLGRRQSQSGDQDTDHTTAPWTGPDAPLLSAPSTRRARGGGGGGDGDGEREMRSDRDRTTATRSGAAPSQQSRPLWRIQKEALRAKFPDGWNPRKRLSPDAQAGIRALHAQFPDVYTTPALAAKFEVSAEAIRRILASHWAPTAEEEEMRHARWVRRGLSVWERLSALGVKPPRPWRERMAEMAAEAGEAAPPELRPPPRRQPDRERRPYGSWQQWVEDEQTGAVRARQQREREERMSWTERVGQSLM